MFVVVIISSVKSLKHDGKKQALFANNIIAGFEKA